jgi:hypothetical protein
MTIHGLIGIARDRPPGIDEIEAAANDEGEYLHLGEAMESQGEAKARALLGKLVGLNDA